MKKLITSIVMVSALVVAVAVGTQALFSDTEVSTGNTFTTGTIDIAVDGENPWIDRDTLSLDDMKPSYTGYIDFVVRNVGANPLNLWKTLENFDTYDVTFPESEEGDISVHDIDSWINYDMRVELYDGDPASTGTLVWWETIYTDSDNVKIGTLENQEMYLGMIPVDWYMKVIQSYHMVDEAGNEYQGDGMTFDIELYAEQLTNEVRLVRKYEADGDLSHHVWDGTYADFSYKVKDDVLNWELETVGVADGNYTLIVWDDTPTYVWAWGNRSNAVVLAKLTDIGNQTHSGSYDPGSDIVNAKVWLVPGHFGTVGGSAGGFNWYATTTYFETGLIDYYDSL